MNNSKLKQQLQTLHEKVDVLRKLDSDILSALETEEDIIGDIVQADIVRETLESTILDLEAALTTQEQNNLPLVQPTSSKPVTHRTTAIFHENGRWSSSTESSSASNARQRSSRISST